MSFRIVDVVENDAPALMRLHLGVLEEERWFITHAREYRHDPFTLLEYIKDMLSQDNCGFWVARDATGPLGFATVTGGHLARIRHTGRFEVMVRSDVRSQGIGKALTEHAVAWSRAHDTLHKLSLAVFDDNERAIALYTGLGFVEEGRRLQEYREADGTGRGDVLMTLFV